MAKYKVDKSLLADVKNEDAEPLYYYLNCMCFFANYLLSDSNLCNSRLLAKCEEVLAYWNQSAKQRAPDANYENLLGVRALGLVGKALFFISKLPPEKQLRKELIRFTNKPKELIGNFFLFYIVSLLACQKCQVSFVPEGNGKTPDLKISDGESYYYIEANARQPRQLIDNNEFKRHQIKALIEEKLSKFSNEQYRPGIIACEVSEVVPLIHSDGSQGTVKLLAETVERRSSGVVIYHLEQDAEWSGRTENFNGLLRHVVEEYSLQDQKDQIAGIFLAVVRQSYLSGSRMRFPSAVLLVIDYREDADKYAALSKVIYTVNKAEVRKRLLGDG